MNSFDARVRYTRMIIENSFLELLRKKPVSKITVTELCGMAQINRATFYKHYQDVPQLLEKLEEQLLERIRTAFTDQSLDFEKFLMEMLLQMKKEGERFMILGSDHGDPNLLSKTFLICYEHAYPILSGNFPGMDESERKMLYQYVSHGSSGILTWWIQNGMQEPPEAVVDFILQASVIVTEEIGARRMQGKKKETRKDRKV